MNAHEKILFLQAEMEDREHDGDTIYESSVTYRKSKTQLFTQIPAKRLAVREHSHWSKTIEMNSRNRAQTLQQFRY